MQTFQSDSEQHKFHEEQFIAYEYVLPTFTHTGSEIEKKTIQIENITAEGMNGLEYHWFVT